MKIIYLSSIYNMSVMQVVCQLHLSTQFVGCKVKEIKEHYMA